MTKGKFTLGGKEYELYYPESIKHDIEEQVREIWEIECYKDGRRKKDSTYLDAGANIGMASLYFKDYAKMIYALEPNKFIFECLKKNTEKYDNIKVFNCGLSAHTGVDYLYGKAGDDSAQSLYPEEGSTYSIETKLYALNDFMEENKIKHIDVMKTDVEGAEFIVFPSLNFAKVANKIDFIIGEYHYQKKSGFAESIPLILKEYGFKTKKATSNKKDYKNMVRTFTYHDLITGMQKSYSFETNTMMVSER